MTKHSTLEPSLFHARRYTHANNNQGTKQEESVTEPQRRDVNFNSFDQVIADIEQLLESGVTTTGQHGFGAIVRHLAIANEMIVGDRIPPKLPWYMRLVMPLIKNSILNKPVTPGFKLPSTDMQSFFWPAESITSEDALARFKASVKTYEERGALPIHPLFGKSTKEQSHGLLLSHAAMHLSFVHPA